MIEKVYTLAQTDEKTIEKLIMNDDINYIHLILPIGEALDRHFSNADVHITILRGILKTRLGEQEEKTYKAGRLIVIPENTEMTLTCAGDEVLEVIIIKAPGPKVSG